MKVYKESFKINEREKTTTMSYNSANKSVFFNVNTARFEFYKLGVELNDMFYLILSRISKINRFIAHDIFNNSNQDKLYSISRKKGKRKRNQVKSIRNIIYSYLPTPPLGQDMTQGKFLSEVLQV